MLAGFKYSQDAEVVIAGGGLGGLSAAAFLAQAGVRVLVLERSQQAGGPCRDVRWQSQRFAVGTNTFGQHCQRLLKALQVSIAFDAAPFCLKYQNADIYFPLRASAFRNGKELGIGLGSILTLLPRLVRVRAQGQSYAEAIKHFTANPTLRGLLAAESWYLGAAPDELPAEALEVFFERSYAYHQPIYPRGGASAVVDALQQVITRCGGRVLLGSDVVALQRHAYDAKGGEAPRSVVHCADGQSFATDWFISNLGGPQTARLLAAAGASVPAPLCAQGASRPRRGLSFAALLMLVPAGGAYCRATAMAPASRSSTLLLNARGVAAEINDLRAGRLPEGDLPVVNLVAPPGLHERGQALRALTALSLWPEVNPVGPQEVQARVAQELKERMLQVLDHNWPGLRSQIQGSRFLTPAAYERELGMSSCPTPELASAQSWEVPWRWPGLSMVGSGMGVRGWHAAAAMESGYRAARDYLRLHKRAQRRS